MVGDGVAGARCPIPSVARPSRVPGPGRVARLRDLVALPGVEHVEVAGPLGWRQQAVVGPLRHRREGLRREVVGRGRGGVGVVGVGVPCQRRRVDREQVDPPPGVAALLEDRFRRILIGPFAVELPSAPDVRGDRQRGQPPPPGRDTTRRRVRSGLSMGLLSGLDSVPQGSPPHPHHASSRRVSVATVVPVESQVRGGRAGSGPRPERLMEPGRAGGRNCTGSLMTSAAAGIAPSRRAGRSSHRLWRPEGRSPPRDRGESHGGGSLRCCSAIANLDRWSLDGAGRSIPGASTSRPGNCWRSTSAVRCRRTCPTSPPSPTASTSAAPSPPAAPASASPTSATSTATASTTT